MDFQSQIKQLADRVATLKPNITTEESTKHSLIMPFLKTLGYDVFDPTTVVPEFTADIGAKKGEKVDYAILDNGKPIILIEAKHHSTNLDNHNAQLLRYYTVTEAKFGILTNGIEYRFFTDLEQTNKMDSKPFLVINLESIKDKAIKDLEQFINGALNIEQIMSMAGRKKYTGELQAILRSEIKDPSDEFVKFFAKKMTDKMLTQTVVEEYRALCKIAFSDIINDLVSDRINYLQAGFKAEVESIDEVDDDKNAIVTTEEELEGYYIVKALLGEVCPMSDVTYKDNASYFNVLYKSNTWKWICRLHFNSKQKYISFPLEDKKDEKIAISKIEDIYSFKDRLQEIVKRYT